MEVPIQKSLKSKCYIFLSCVFLPNAHCMLELVLFCLLPVVVVDAAGIQLSGGIGWGPEFGATGTSLDSRVHTETEKRTKPVNPQLGKKSPIEYRLRNMI